jgi:formylglycine-generating enzyme required for sulfatase activity/tRNA A-37 threonylcarbamoyl transferase component Bud32
VNNQDEELLAELLLQWEELYERGQDSSPQELCRDCPHLIEVLGKRIAAMRATNWLNNPDCPADVPVVSTSHSSGKVLGGRYRLDDLIATGGFAEVWRAFDTELQRIVAIKLPKPNRLVSATNFITEARRVARLKHPSIVPVFDVGTEGDSCFIVSEYVEGGSLGDRLTTKPPSSQETSQWLSEIAAALEYAHLHGVVHRDIKPANILIDHHGRALLADFGIAQSAQKTGTFAPSLGTLRYMSPEQLEGKAATPQSDVYSLGVVLHECLTGRLPYSSNEPSVLRREIVEGAKQLAKEVPAALLDVCQKAMKRLPHERHTSAAHFATDLERAAGKTSLRERCWSSPLFWATLFALPLIAALAVNAFLLLAPKLATVPKGLNTGVEAPPEAATQDASAESPAEPIVEVKQLPTIENSIGMTLIEIPPGYFLMGSHNGRPNHKVQITRPFYLGQTEVTNAQWRKVMASVPSEWKDEERPVEHVSWEDAAEFCRKLSASPEEKAAKIAYRLPTEAEWEFACRAGTTTRHWFGDDDSLVGNYAWLYWNSRGTTHPVGKKKPNPWGLYDMRGNVWEWCSDWSDVTEYAPNEIVVDPQGPSYSAESKRVVRGGCLGDNPDSFASESPPETRTRGIGFRVVAVLKDVASP